MHTSVHDAWARFRFAVVGPLLSAPPERGALRFALLELAMRIWRHPVTNEPVRLAFSTIERWYYEARTADNPIDALRKQVRKDAGLCRIIGDELKKAVHGQYRLYPYWSFQLHYDNLAVLATDHPALGGFPSYPTFVRYMKLMGLRRQRRQRHEGRPGLDRARDHREQREVRTYEVEHVGALWHLDFHTSSVVRVITPDGTWQLPELFAVLDDHSRLCCHAQFYLSETTEDLVHGFSQALLKRGLPRALLCDNGAAMIGAEFTEGLARLSITHEPMLPYSPEQNGKQEHFWAVVEGRFLAMLDRAQHLDLERLNLLLQAWVELEYNRRLHSEIATTPLERFQNSRDVSRPAPAVEKLRDVFRKDVLRTLRRSDGSFSLEGKRFEVPACYRHLSRLHVRYARWDLGCVHLVDPRSQALLSRLFPLDRAKNASGERRLIDPTISIEDTHALSDGLPPLMQRLLQEYSATGLPPSYLPKPPMATDPDHGDNDERK